MEINEVEYDTLSEFAMDWADGCQSATFSDGVTSPDEDEIALAKGIQEIEKENERLRAALEEICEAGPIDHPRMREIAQQALKKKESEE